MISSKNEPNNQMAPNIKIWDILTGIIVHPVQAVTMLMKSPKPVSLSLIFIFLTFIFSSLLLPTILKKSQEELQTSELIEQLTPEQYSEFTKLTPLRRGFASALLTLTSFWSVVFQGFVIYLYFSIARYPGLYREYFNAVLAISFIDTLLPMIVTFFIPFFAADKINLASLLSGLKNPWFAYLQSIDVFTLIALLILAAGIANYANAPKKRTIKIITFYLVVRTLFFGSINLFFS